jgi:hypothetical protein
MGVHHILGRNVIWWEDKNLNKYWSKYSKHIINKYPVIDNSNHKQIVEIFKDSFGFFVNEFETQVRAETSVDFFAFVLGLHDTSFEIYLDHLDGASIAPFDERDFATYRRILKLILEQSCDINLVAGVNIINDMSAKRNKHKDKVEDLMYLGLWVYAFAEHVAHMDLMGPIHGLEVGEDGIVSILTNQPFGFLIDEIKKDYNNHTDKVVVDIIGIGEFKLAVEAHLSVNYDNAGQFLQGQVTNPNHKFGLIPYQGLKNFSIQNFGYTEDQMETFYSGLILKRSNKLDVIDSVLNPQKNERHIYRPMLLLNTNLGQCLMVSLLKWGESITTLTTNAISWGYAPSEWINNKGFKQYAQDKIDSHDKLLEDEVEKILKKESIKFDRNIKSFKNITCDVPEAGEMDFVYIDEVKKIIYILESKNNRSRFDMVSYRKEYSNFTRTYEPRLKLKIKWIEQNIELVNEHFNDIYPEPILDISKYSVKGIFLINAPNFYLYNGNMPCFTLTTFEELIQGKYIEKKYEITLEREAENLTFLVEKPYFTNTHRAINEE